MLDIRYVCLADVCVWSDLQMKVLLVNYIRNNIRGFLSYCATDYPL